MANPTVATKRLHHAPPGTYGATVRVIDLFSQSTSVVVTPQGQTTAQQIAEDSLLLAARLQMAGLEPGDRVAVRLQNSLGYLQLLATCSAARLVLVSVNTRYSQAEVDDLVARSGARLVIDRPEVIDALPAASAPITSDRALADDPYLVFTTSGTTSKPKMVRHRQRSIAVHGRHAAAGFNLTNQDRVLVVMPLCGTFGLSSLMAGLGGNATIVLTDRTDPASVAELISAQRITALNASDDLFHRLVELPGSDLSSVRLGGYARFNSSLDGIVERAETAGATLAGLYGMSEVQALYALRDPSLDAAGRSAAGGTPVAAEAAARVVDGELQLQGPSLFEGYLVEGGDRIDDNLTSGAFDDGWFCTGDSADMDSADIDALQGPGRDSTFTYHARLNDVLRLGGFLVAPADIEAVLLVHPFVEEAQVVSVDLPTGARPVAFVIGSQTAPPISPDLERDIIRHCGEHLAKYKVPVRIVQLEEFPITPGANGNKIQLVKLRQAAKALLAP
jgi:fatty-acyl-CoA synthase